MKNITVYVYDNKRPAYVSDSLVKSWEGGDCCEMVAELPEGWEAEENEFQNLILISPNGVRFLVYECMDAPDGYPRLFRKELNVLEERRRSIALTLED